MGVLGGESKQYLSSESMYRMAMGQYEQAYTLMKRYAGVADSTWANGYATCLHDALRLAIEDTDKSNIPDGFSKFEHPDGFSDEGNWKAGRPNEEGLLITSNGMTYKEILIKALSTGWDILNI